MQQGEFVWTLDPKGRAGRVGWKEHASWTNPSGFQRLLLPASAALPTVRREQYAEQPRERLTTHDALSYLREVKNRFSSNRKVYDR